MEVFRYIVGSILLLLGLVIFMIEVFGVNRFRYALNRMHAAALGDTLGLTCSLLGLMCVSGWNYNTLKMILVDRVFLKLCLFPSHPGISAETVDCQIGMDIFGVDRRQNCFHGISLNQGSRYRHRQPFFFSITFLRRHTASVWRLCEQ